ncbi:MAG: PrgI family mobile element protein [Bacillota bacterium]
MRLYRTPILLDEEPKIFGGKATLRQAMYVLTGVVGAFAMHGALRPFSAGVGLAGAGAILAFAAALAFVRVPGLDMPLDRYLWALVLFYVRPREFPYRRDVP